MTTRFHLLHLVTAALLLLLQSSSTASFPVETETGGNEDNHNDVERRQVHARTTWDQTTLRTLRSSNHICREYCSLYSQALDRCPYSVPDAPTNPGQCLVGCKRATFSKADSEFSFSSDSLQCRMNHALMAIKEGPLTNSKHCLHASLAGPERCSRDDTALANDKTIAVGKSVFYYPSVFLGKDSPLSPVQASVAAVQFFIAARGRLYSRYPYLDLTKKGKKIDCTKTDLRYRSVDGTCNSATMPLMGAVGTPFTRSTKGSPPHKDGDASIAEVANILRRPSDQAGDLAPFNQLAVAWIQFMTHDWFQHDKDETPGEGMRNKVTHWWDASQIYGSTQAEADALRAPGGKLHLDDNDELDYDEHNTPKTGFTGNFWVGLHVMHTIFAREHNYLVDAMEGTMTDDEKYGAARNCIAAILAKIHTLEWTPTLLDNTISTFGLNINWYGLKTVVSNQFTEEDLEPYAETIDKTKAPSVLNSEFDTDLTLFNTSFFMTEEFVSVYRMHPLLPDEIEVEGETLTLQDVVFVDARDIVEENTTETFLRAFAETPARALSLKNYPNSLYDLTLGAGGDTINLAEIDLARDRERNIPRYNDARRQLMLEPYTSIDDLTTDKEEIELLKSVYTDIEQVDFMVGCLADQERPEGFAFGAVPFYIFIVMASRRLLSDRFYQEGLTVENYTPFGLDYVVTTKFEDILKRQFPAMANDIPSNPFSNNWVP